MIYFNFTKQTKFDKKWGLFALIGKMIGAFFFLLVYTYYFNKLGDTFAYLGISNKLYLLILKNPSIIFEVFTPNTESKSIEFYQFIKEIDFYSEWDTYTVILFSTGINFFTLGLPFATTIVFSAISFIGLWKLYLIINRIFPEKKIEALIACLFVPSVVFWGSGVLKDTLVMGFFGFFLHSFFSVILYREIKFKNWFWLIVSPTIIALIKPYIILSIIPSLLFFFLSLTTKRIKNLVIKLVVLPILVIIISGISVYTIVKIGDFFPQYSTERVLETAQKYQLHHYAGGNVNAEGAGSGYSLGDYKATFFGVLTQVPLAINVTLFRPYLWEIRNPGMLISAFESFIFLIITVFILFKSGFINSFKIIRGHEFLIFSTVFFLFFAFAVGFSSYNFGALARYKIPCLPFFIFVLLFLFKESKKRKKKLSILK